MPMNPIDSSESPPNHNQSSHSNGISLNELKEDLPKQNQPSSAAAEEDDDIDDTNESSSIPSPSVKKKTEIEKTATLTDAQFHSLLHRQLADAPGRNDYPTVYEKCIDAMVKWRHRYRGNPKLWQRVFRKDKVLKELIESAPIIDAVMKFVDSYSFEENEQKITIMDLCSGKGYLSMFLSEILSSDKVEKLILVDKAWACYGTKDINQHHMSSEHIYGEIRSLDENEKVEKISDTTNTITPIVANAVDHCRVINKHNDDNEKDEGTYFPTWPIRLHASKQDLKAGRNKRQMKKHYFDKIKGPIIILAIHLCGTLSLRAVDMFNNHDNVKLFALKPCCLPTMIHARRKVIFKIGQHEFKAEEVCSHGEFKKGVWSGPARFHLEGKFDKWANHLFDGVDVIGMKEDPIESSGNVNCSSIGIKSKEKIGKK